MTNLVLLAALFLFAFGLLELARDAVVGYLERRRDPVRRHARFVRGLGEASGTYGRRGR